MVGASSADVRLQQTIEVDCSFLSRGYPRAAVSAGGLERSRKRRSFAGLERIGQGRIVSARRGGCGLAPPGGCTPRVGRRWLPGS